MLAFLPPFITPRQNSNERPASITGRRAEAEKVYQEFYSRSGTHNFIEWGRNVNGELLARHVPPYCDRFDEFLAFWMAWDDPLEIPLLLESMFPEYDAIDLDYLEDVFFTLERISAWKEEPYAAQKGSGQELGPVVSWRYNANLLRAKRWLEAAKHYLNQKQQLQIKQPKTLKVASRPKDKTALTDVSSSLNELFISGFTTEKLNIMLIALGIITEDRDHTAESKPKSWRAIVEALRANKCLIRTDAPRLHRALAAEFGVSEGHLPSIRTLQDDFAPKNAAVKQLYERASTWLKSN